VDWDCIFLRQKYLSCWFCSMPTHTAIYQADSHLAIVLTLVGMLASMTFTFRHQKHHFHHRCSFIMTLWWFVFGRDGRFTFDHLWRMVLFVTYVSPLCDDWHDIMKVNSICDNRFWSGMIHHFRHNLPSVRRLDGTINGVCVLWRSGYVIDSLISRHYHQFGSISMTYDT
jgi:hypothetical protein